MNTRTVLGCFVSTLLLAALAAPGSAQNLPPESKPQSSSEAGAGSNGLPAKRASVSSRTTISLPHTLRAVAWMYRLNGRWTVFSPKTL